MSPASPPPVLTSVKLLADGELTAHLLCGTPVGTLPLSRGQIALLPAGQIAAYLVRSGRLTGFFIFRTGVPSGTSSVPGVGAPVLLFLVAGRRREAARTRNFLRKLSRYGHDPSSLSDDFWTRAAGAIGARVRPTRQLLDSLLKREAAWQGAAAGSRDGRARDRRVRARGVAPHPELHAEPPAWRVLAATRASRDQG